MASYTESGLPLEFLLSTGNGDISFEQVTLTASQGDLAPGRVLAKVTGTGNYVPYDNASGTAGIGTADAILCYAAANSGSTQAITVVKRFATVKAAALGWGSNDSTGITAGTADLAASPNFIFART